MSTKKILKYGAIVVVALIIFIIIGRNAGWIGSKPQIPVTLEKVEKRTIVEIVSANGKIQPVIEIKISPDVSGEIVDLPIKEGQYVKRGDLLARINPDLYESALDRVSAALNTTKANLANAKARQAQAEAQFINATASYERNKSLFDQDAISQAEYDQARSQFLVAKAETEAAAQSVIGAEYQVKSSEAALKEARESLTKTTIVAPMDGTISRLDSELGERVVGTSQFAGTEIMRIANLSEMEVMVEVNENDIIRVNLGDTANIEIDAYLGEKFKGVVSSIANSAKTQGLGIDQVTNFEVKILILPQSYEHLKRPETKHLSPFRPGMSASVDIQTKTVFDVLSVPIQSVTTRDAKTFKKEKNDVKKDSIADVVIDKNKEEEKPVEVVFVFEKGIAKQVAVKTGIQDSYYIEILEGLEIDQEIITGPYHVVSRNLNDGDEVVKTERKELFGEK
jgi:HlyD family secretion protein